MATIQAPKGWSRMKQTALHVISDDEFNSLPVDYQARVMAEADKFGIAPMTVTRTFWQDIQFNVWCDGQSFEDMA